MDEPLIRVLQGRASRKEELEVQQWRLADPINEAKYARLEAIWGLSGTNQEIDRDGPIPSAADLLKESSDISAGSRSTPDGLRRGTRGSWQAGWAAAAILIIALGTGYSFFFGGPSGPEPVTFHALADESTTARLADGSVVQLAPGSRLRYSASPDSRMVELEGSAYFSVTSDPERPFVASTGSHSARVLGTRFVIEDDEGGLRLSVVEGNVRFGSMDGPIDVGLGERVVAIPGQTPRLEPMANPYGDFPWLDGFMAFEATPLTKAGEEIEVRLGIAVEFADEELRGREVTAWFVDEAPRDILDVICLIANAQCTYDETGVTMSLRRD